MIFFTASSPANCTAFAHGAVQRNACHKASSLVNCQGQNTDCLVFTFRPTDLQMASIFPSSLKVNGPGVPGGGGGNKRETARNTVPASQVSSLPQMPITTFPYFLTTRLASASAFSKLPAY